MDNRNSNNGFSYTYSAEEQTELKRIREKYAPEEKEEDKMERILRLDARVTQRAQVASLVLGIVGALILGFGMSLCMTSIGTAMGLGGTVSMALGIIIGIIGGIPVGFAYPVYNLVLKHEREKVAPEILRLTDELMK